MRLQVDRDLRAGKAVGQTFPAPRAVPGRSTVVGGGEPSLGAGPLTIAVAVGALVLFRSTPCCLAPIDCGACAADRAARADGCTSAVTDD